jgi:hypothetical protein
MASTALIEFEMEAKRALSRYCEGSGVDLMTLLKAVKYAGGAKTVNNLTLGTIIECFSALRRHHPHFGHKYTAQVETDFRRLVPLRNTAQHEIALDRVPDVLSYVQAGLSHEAFWRIGRL